MTISLTEIIAALEAKSNATDSSTAISDILRLTRASEDVSDGTILYDSAGVMPTDSAFIGTLAATAAGTIYFYNGTSWNAVDSAESIIPPPPPYSFPGSTSGYTSGGKNMSPSTTKYNIIEKNSFASDGNATDVGDLTQYMEMGTTGASSTENGYTLGGAGNTTTPNPTTYSYNNILKFSFSVDGNATDIADLLNVGAGIAGQSSETHGYSTGGDPATNVIDKFPFSVDENSTDVGDLTQTYVWHAGHSSSTSGYISGHLSRYTNIEKFPFATDGNATDVGDMTMNKGQHAGQSSETYGYNSGGYGNPGSPPNSYLNNIDKFSFSTDGNATDVGDLSVSRGYVAGQSATSNGYTSGGTTGPAGPNQNVIDKFPFSTDANATDVGDLTVARARVQGNQV